MAGLLAGSPLLHAQLDPRTYTSHKRTPGLTEMFTAFDFEPVMFANVAQSVYDYTAHGDGGEWNLRRNRQAFGWVDILPGKSVDPSRVDLSSSRPTTFMIGARAAMLTSTRTGTYGRSNGSRTVAYVTRGR